MEFGDRQRTRNLKHRILFEAGALSKSIEKSHVCTLLFDLEPAEVKGPLTSFQATRFIKDDFKKLVITINSAAGDARLDSAVLDTVFEMWWPKLEEQVATILKSHNKGAKKEKRSDRDILEELLELTRLSTTRPPRPSRISPRAVMELVESLDELGFILARQPDDIGIRILHRIERPIRHLCIEAGMPEAYERFRMLRGRREPLEPELEKRITEADDPPDG